MARPRGSSTGRTPAGGYPDVGPEFGAFLAGFLEGEACFSIQRQHRNENHRCSVTVAVRDDDSALLNEIATATRIGTIRARGNQGTSRPQVSWTVQAKSDCLRLSEVLDEFPLRGKKSYDYAIWRAALMFWIGEDPTVYRKGRDWAALRYLKTRLEETRRFDPRRGPYEMTEGGPDKHGDWPGYLSGLLTADGTLVIVRNGRRFSPGVQITLRADDEPLLREIERRTGAGRVYRRAGRDEMRRQFPGVFEMERDFSRSSGCCTRTGREASAGSSFGFGARLSRGTHRRRTGWRSEKTSGRSAQSSQRSARTPQPV